MNNILKTLEKKEKSMKIPWRFVRNRPPEVSAIEIVDHLQREILQTSHETSDPYDALFKAYEQLTDEQKMAFLLTGGAECLFQYQRERIEQRRTGRCSSDTGTDQLPIPC